MRVPEPTFLESSASKIALRYKGSAWVMSHLAASTEPEPITELPLALMIEGAMRYFQNNPDLTKDRFIYPQFSEMVECMRQLLNSSTGRFDQGVLDELLYNMTEEFTKESEGESDEPHGARDPIDPRD